MKILIANTYDKEFLSEYPNSETEILEKSYHDHLAFLLEQKVGISNFYSKQFINNQHQASNIILNDNLLQSKWATENDLKISKDRFQKIPGLRNQFYSNWSEKIFEAQISSLGPDVIYNLNPRFYQTKFLKKLKNKYKFQLIGQIASQLPSRNYFEPYDLLISSLPHYVELFRKMGKPAEYIQLGFDSSILQKDSLTKNRQYDTTHIGGYGDIHESRNDFLEKVAREINIDFWGRRTSKLKKESQILERFHGTVWGLDMFRVLLNSKITITKHIDEVASKYANNMTLYEATGCGCLLITDKKQNINDIFDEGKEVVTYNNVDDCVEKIKYYLQSESERSQIAAAGQKRTLSDHTYENRVKKILAAIDKHLTI